MSPVPAKAAAAEQVGRLLLLIPYLQAHPGARLADVAREFGLPPDQVRRDLSVAFLCGLPGGLPGDLIDVDLDLVDDEGVIYLTNAAVLARPVTLTPDEAMGLIVALQAVREVAAGSLHPVIDSLLAKLAAVGPGALETPALSVAAGAPATRDRLLRAISQAERVELVYDGLARGKTSRPLVDPVRLFVADGVAYLSGWSVTRQGWRTYRLDRIADVRATGEVAAAHGPEPAHTWLDTLAQAPPVRLIVHPGAQWITEYYPVAGQVRLPNGDLDVTLPVADPAWLRWLLLRLGPGVAVVGAPAVTADAAHAAQAALAAYAYAGLE
ncbi:MAG: WYL domain-containing protein [Propionibacteriaceae bacterium]|jgi:proteasome accessory factor C|nr:WYL domain-containing protein [Propionibacteriaceae bacterium]